MTGVVGRGSIVLLTLGFLVGECANAQANEVSAKTTARDLVRKAMALDTSH